MSLWLVAVGWIWIAAGTYTAWRDGRPLLSRTGRGGQETRRGRYVRRKAWRDLEFSLFQVVSGVVFVTGLYKHQLSVWLIAGYAVTLVLLGPRTAQIPQRTQVKRSASLNALTPTCLAP